MHGRDDIELVLMEVTNQMLLCQFCGADLECRLTGFICEGEIFF